MALNIPTIPCKMFWGEIREETEEKSPSHRMSPKTIWKVIDVQGKDDKISFSELIQRIRYVSCRLYEKIRSSEKEVRASILRNGTFSFRLFLSENTNLEEARKDARYLLQEKNFILQEEQEVGNEKSYAGIIPLPRAQHTKAVCAEGIEEVLGEDTWNFERCFMTKEDPNPFTLLEVDHLNTNLLETHL